MLVSYNWLKDYLGADAPDVDTVSDLLGYHTFEIEGVEKKGDDTVIDIDVLPNRSSDCLSHRGIAREISTLTGKPLAVDPFTQVPSLAQTDQIIIDIQNGEVCPRFTASLFTDIEITQSPQWLKDRLEVLGQRPINNIVDATNYVMLGLGQPMHVYDADLFPQVDGVWQFGVRTAKEGETISLLPEGGKGEARIIELIGSETLVVDKSSDTPVGLAGVKGGTFAEVHAGTKNIIVEAATWHPTFTRKTARRLGIVIDASKRYENELSPEMPIFAQVDIVKLIANIAGGKFQGVVDVYPVKSEPVTVEVSPEHVNALLSLSLSPDEMEEILVRAGVTVEQKDDVLLCTGPWERTDLTLEADFTEEIGRIHGYDHVASVVPEPVPSAEINVRHYYSEQVREVLIGLGFSEVITSSFRKKDDIHLHNALASDKEYMRSNLASGIGNALDKNAGFTDLLGLTDTRVFEIGTVFHKIDSGIVEHVALALGVRTKASGYNQKDDLQTADAIKALEEKLSVTLEVTTEKAIAEINFTKVFETLPAPVSYEPVEAAPEISYKPFSLYPAMTRDIAMWVTEGTEVSDVEKVLNEAAGDLRVRTTHVDEFTKEGRTSLAFRLVFQSMDRTLTDDEINAQMDKVYQAATKQNWETR